MQTPGRRIDAAFVNPLKLRRRRGINADRVRVREAVVGGDFLACAVGRICAAAASLRRRGDHLWLTGQQTQPVIRIAAIVIIRRDCRCLGAETFCHLLIDGCRSPAV